MRNNKVDELVTLFTDCFEFLNKKDFSAVIELMDSKLQVADVNELKVLCVATKNYPDELIQEKRKELVTMLESKKNKLF